VSSRLRFKAAGFLGSVRQQVVPPPGKFRQEQPCHQAILVQLYIIGWSGRFPICNELRQQRELSLGLVISKEKSILLRPAHWIIGRSESDPLENDAPLIDGKSREVIHLRPRIDEDTSINAYGVGRQLGVFWGGSG